jgi:hypothetical protein
MPKLLAALALFASSAALADDWGPFEPLLGEWVAGTGGYHFQRELQGRVLVRRNRSESPAAEGRPASVHEDLMVVSRAPSGEVRADYWDNEGHRIEYRVEAAADGKSWTFVSSGAPAFRLVYSLQPSGEMKGEFAISPGGGADGFKQYLGWSARKKG